MWRVERRQTPMRATIGDELVASWHGERHKIPSKWIQNEFSESTLTCKRHVCRLRIELDR